MTCIDLASRQVGLVKEFKDRIYMTMHFPKVGRYFILDDGRLEYSYDLKSHRLGPQMPSVYNRNICWIDDIHFLTVVENQLLMRDLSTGKQSVIYDGLPQEAGADALAMSPDCSTIALMQEPRLTVLSMKGRIIYQSREPIILFQHDIVPAEVNLCWRDGHTLLYDAVTGSREAPKSSNIYQLDLITSQTRILIPGARKPVVSPQGSHIVFERPTSEFLKMTYHVLDHGLERELLPCRDHECEHFLFVNESTLVFERGK